eukprot:TRINITY_DN8549_c0_g3_i10.p1 TRINITY_DN8549_c0_g3~~TRINITY_DN8549_c0_g3_i10.p1  ORF type:complete len:199 (+),score=7.77 TRINITY_DN8549_c0_g3_i10:144-740(+)
MYMLHRNEITFVPVLRHTFHLSKLVANSTIAHPLVCRRTRLHRNDPMLVTVMRDMPFHLSKIVVTLTIAHPSACRRKRLHRNEMSLIPVMRHVFHVSKVVAVLAVAHPMVAVLAIAHLGLLTNQAASERNHARCCDTPCVPCVQDRGHFDHSPSVGLPAKEAASERNEARSCDAPCVPCVQWFADEPGCIRTKSRSLL